MDEQNSEDCPVEKEYDFDYGTWEVTWTSPYEGFEPSQHQFKAGCTYSPSLTEITACRWLVSIDGSDNSTVGVDINRIDSLTDAELVELIRCGAKAAKKALATVRITGVLEDFDGYANALWTVQEFQRFFKEDYNTLCGYRQEPEAAKLLSIFDYLWQGNTQKSGYVYCLSDQQGHYKLGKSRQLHKRIKQLGTQPPFRIKLLFAHHVLDADLYERSLHRAFA